MTIETKTKEINNETYSVTQLPARRALRLQAKLIKLFGPAAAEIFVAAGTNLSTADHSLPKAISLLTNELDDKTFDSLVIEMLQGSRKNGEEITEKSIDLMFAGKLNDLFLLLAFVVEVNYGDFFQEGGILKGLLQAKEEVTQVPHPLRKD